MPHSPYYPMRAFILLCAGTKIASAIPVTQLNGVFTSGTLILPSVSSSLRTISISQQSRAFLPSQSTTVTPISSAVATSAVLVSSPALSASYTQWNRSPSDSLLKLTARMTGQLSSGETSVIAGPSASSEFDASVLAISTSSALMATTIPLSSPSIVPSTTPPSVVTASSSPYPPRQATTTVIAAAIVSSLPSPVQSHAVNVSSAQIMGVVGAFLITIFVAFFILHKLSFMPCVRRVRAWRSRDRRTTSPFAVSEKRFDNRTSLEGQWMVQEPTVQLPSANVWPGTRSMKD